jgi:hypothetical protein
MCTFRKHFFSATKIHYFRIGENLVPSVEAGHYVHPYMAENVKKIKVKKYRLEFGTSRVAQNIGFN